MSDLLIQAMKGDSPGSLVKRFVLMFAAPWVGLIVIIGSMRGWNPVLVNLAFLPLPVFIFYGIGTAAILMTLYKKWNRYGAEPGPPEWRPATAADTVGLDIRQLDRVADLLQQQGFTKLGDIINCRESRLFPDARAVGRILLNPSGTISCSLYLRKTRGLKGFLFPGSLLGDGVMIVAKSELENGNLVITCVQSGFQAEPDVPGMKYTVLPPASTTAVNLLDRHEREIATRAEGKSCRALTSIDDVVDAQYRLYTSLHEHLSKKTAEAEREGTGGMKPWKAVLLWVTLFIIFLVIFVKISS